MGGTCDVLFCLGLPFCTRGGLELLDVVDRFGVSYFLLLGCFLEIMMFHADFGWRRLAAHVRIATLGSVRTPSGRGFAPQLYWKLCLCVTAPLFTGLLFIQLLVEDLTTPYGGYPAGLLAFGWCLLVALLIIAPLGWFKLDRTPGSLPPLEELLKAGANPACAGRTEDCEVAMNALVCVPEPEPQL